MKRISALAFLFAVAVTIGPAQAQINQTQAQQQARISAGMRDGSLTAQEAAQLQARSNQITSLENRLRSDGRLSQHERAMLQSQLSQLNSQIYSERHDRNGRVGYNNGNNWNGNNWNSNAGYHNGGNNWNSNAGYHNGGNNWNGSNGYGGSYRQHDRRFLGYRDRNNQNINAQQARAQQRIQNGMSDGSLNAAEAARMQNRFNNINTAEARMRASGGGLNFNERARLDNRVDNLGRSIQRQRNDRR